jgi:hypothetical protein
MNCYLYKLIDINLIINDFKFSYLFAIELLIVMIINVAINLRINVSHPIHEINIFDDFNHLISSLKSTKIKRRKF